jgi:hypothetical protein
MEKIWRPPGPFGLVAWSETEPTYDSIACHQRGMSTLLRDGLEVANAPAWQFTEARCPRCGYGAIRRASVFASLKHTTEYLALN